MEGVSAIELKAPDEDVSRAACGPSTGSISPYPGGASWACSGRTARASRRP